MAILIGTFRPDELRGTAGNDLISGRGGDDLLFGEGGFDRIFGGIGNDLVFGTGLLRGGRGHDDLGGSGLLLGDAGRDELDLFGQGVAFGGPGRDVLRAVLIFAPGEERTLIGGRGADEFRVDLSPLDGVATRAELLDFRPRQGDHLLLDQRDLSGALLVDAAQTFAALDRNGDRMLSADDGGSVHLDPEGLTLQGLDGDAVLLIGRSFALAGDFLLG